MKGLELQTWIDDFSPEEINIDKIEEYLNFIKEASERYDPERYSEWHHVIPKCIDNEKKFRDQGVRINGYDHFIAHMKLVECFNGQLKCRMSFALVRMRSEIKLTMSPEEYEEIKLINSRSRSISNLGRKHSSLTKIKMSTSRSENHADVSGEKNPMYNKRRITNGISNSVIGPEDELPKGWKYGMTSKLRNVSGENNPAYGRFWITDGKNNKFITLNEEIPEGWFKGTTLKKRSYRLICKSCGCKFLGNSPNQSYCDSCK